MGNSVHDNGAPALAAGGTGFGLAMSACLRAQAAHEQRTWFQRLRGANPLSAEASELYAHGVGELESAVALAALGGDWIVAAATDEQNASRGADHVVVGPAGVFAVCSRRHPDAKAVTAGRMILVDGGRVAYVRDASILAERLTDSFAALGAPSVKVQPLVALMGTSELVHGRMKAPVPVLSLRDVAAWLIRHEVVYSRAEVAALAPVAARLSGWNVRPAATGASVRLTARFERLRTEVDAARRRYHRWLVAGGAVALAATVTMVVVAIPAVVALFAG
ncbi:hypothetical protein [Salinibacterium sp. SWN1162]|uniref:hypothetical protein n=1 Tax=Salinibacterium sp. SWN1162 TaxID=2792053 RepID=UPI0018CF905F|nr:hypothetical protein [Salinibacterium sp. SWN1162]MBH0010383.1 hypothetical protein [Salinibacterium sp. SWN1162]